MRQYKEEIIKAWLLELGGRFDKSHFTTNTIFDFMFEVFFYYQKINQEVSVDKLCLKALKEISLENLAALSEKDLIYTWVPNLKEHCRYMREKGPFTIQSSIYRLSYSLIIDKEQKSQAFSRVLELFLEKDALENNTTEFIETPAQKIKEKLPQKI